MMSEESIAGLASNEVELALELDELIGLANDMVHRFENRRLVGQEYDDLHEMGRRLWSAIDKAPTRGHTLVFNQILLLAARLSLQVNSSVNQLDLSAQSAHIYLVAIRYIQIIARERKSQLTEWIRSAIRGSSDHAFYELHRAKSYYLFALAAEILNGEAYKVQQTIRHLPPEASTTEKALAAIEASSHLKFTFNMANLIDLADLERSGWAATCEAVRTSDTMSEFDVLSATSASAATTPIAAMRSKRNVVYLVAGSRSGAAVRFRYGEKVTSQPQSIELPKWNLQHVWDARARVDEVFDQANNVSERELDRALRQILAEIGLAVARPIQRAWPDLRRVALIPLGESLTLPYAQADVDGSPWASITDLIVSPSARCLLVASMQRLPKAERSVVVMGDPGEGGDFLPNIAPEVESVSAVWGTKPTFLQQRSDEPAASIVNRPARVRDAVKRYPSQSHVSDDAPQELIEAIHSGSVVHLACHGEIPTDDSHPSLLRLGGVMSISQLVHRGFEHGSVIILSACTVGGERREAPFEILGFPGAIISGGAGTVIASHWPVLDAPETVEFMVDMHRELRAGTSANLALAHAVERAADHGVAASVWGGFCAYGS